LAITQQAATPRRSATLAIMRNQTLEFLAANGGAAV